MAASAAIEKCNGCGACELACAFRATGTFWVPASAIQIMKAPAGSEASYRIWVDPRECDLCEGESETLCQRACIVGILSSERIRFLMKAPISD